MPTMLKTVPAPELIGTRGYPIHYEAFGLTMPTREIEIEVDEDGNETGASAASPVREADSA